MNLKNCSIKTSPLYDDTKCRLFLCFDGGFFTMVCDSGRFEARNLAHRVLALIHGQMPLKPKETSFPGKPEAWAKSVAQECYDYIKSQDGGIGEAAMENMVEAIQKAAECHYDRLGYKRTGNPNWEGTLFSELRSCGALGGAGFPYGSPRYQQAIDIIRKHAPK